MKFVVVHNNGDLNSVRGIYDNYYEACGHACALIYDEMHDEDGKLIPEAKLVKNWVHDDAYDCYWQWEVQQPDGFWYVVYVYQYNDED